MTRSQNDRSNRPVRKKALLFKNPFFQNELAKSQGVGKTNPKMVRMGRESPQKGGREAEMGGMKAARVGWKGWRRVVGRWDLAERGVWADGQGIPLGSWTVWAGGHPVPGAGGPPPEIYNPVLTHTCLIFFSKNFWRI